MVNCSVLKCKNRSVKDGVISFFSFPKEESVANAWLKYCRPKTNIRTGRVCSVHFLKSDYHKPLMHILMNISPRKCRKLKPDAIPSLHLNTIDEPVIIRSLNTDMKFMDADLSLTEHKELTISNNATSYSVQTQTHIKTYCVGTQTTELWNLSSNTISIPLSEYEDLMRIKNKYRIINKQLSQTGQKNGS